MIGKQNEQQKMDRKKIFDGPAVITIFYKKNIDFNFDEM